MAHCNQKSLEQGLTPVYDLSGPTYTGSGDLLWYDNIVEHLDRNGWRLPSSDEWTLAYLAGTSPSDQYFWGNNTSPAVAGQYAIYGGIDNFVAGSKLPNAWGLFDMAGSFAEWVGPFVKNSSCWKAYGGSNHSAVDGIKYSSYECKDGVFTNTPSHRLNIGLRMVRNAPPNLTPFLGLLLQ
jgi:formylglycine-generating enzyme required for sulfatase activity